MEWGRLGDWDVYLNECIDSTMGRIHVCFLYCLLVTIRELVGSFSADAASSATVDPDAPNVLQAMMLFQQANKNAQAAQDYEHSFAADSGRKSA